MLLIKKYKFASNELMYNILHPFLIGKLLAELSPENSRGYFGFCTIKFENSNYKAYDFKFHNYIGGIHFSEFKKHSHSQSSFKPIAYFCKINLTIIDRFMAIERGFCTKSPVCFD